MRLYIHDLNQQDISGFGGLDFERAREVMDACEIDILHIIGTVIIGSQV